MNRAGFASSALLRQRRRNPQLPNNSNGGERKHRPSYGMIVAMAALLVIGAVVVYAIGPGLTNGTDLSENYYSSKQLIAILLGCIGFLLASKVRITSWEIAEPFIIALAVVVTILVRLVGEEINGAHRWIQIAGFSFQAAELIKLALVLWISRYIATKRAENKMSDPTTIKTLGILVGVIIVVVAGLQSDLGSAAVMMSIVGVLAFIGGLPWKKLVLVAIGVVLLSMLAIASSPYRRDRVLTYLRPEADCQVEGYQACQALITIGSGGIFGKGLGRSVQAYGYLPEPANDSIFAIVSEKFGFVGSTVVVALFITIFISIKKVASSAPTDYTRLLCAGVLVWLSVQMIINIGAMVGLLPLKGITLPFVSYGGTSIIFVMIAMGIVFNVSKYTDLSVGRNPVHKDSILTTTRYTASASRGFGSRRAR